MGFFKWLLACIVAAAFGVGVAVVKEHYGDQISDFSRKQIASIMG